MGAEQLKRRTREFGISIIKLVQQLPDRGPIRTVGQQLTDCGTSVGANFRAACRAKSPRDFIAKLKIVEEECDESIYWMELLLALNLSDLSPSIKALVNEANQILAITVASIKTARLHS